MDPHDAVQVRKPRPIEGWALQALVRYDEAYPGILRFTMSASAFRRQSIFLVLAAAFPNRVDMIADRVRGLLAEDFPSSDNPHEAIAQALMKSRARDLLQALFGPVEGLVGALNRLGPNPLHPLKYRGLVDLLSNPKHEARAKVLRQLQTIAPDTMLILRMLRPSFLHVDVVQRLYSFDRVQQFHVALDLIRDVRPGVTDDELLASIKALGPKSKLENWAERWLAKAVFPSFPPIQDDDEWVGLRSGEAMHDAGRRFANCLKTKVSVAAMGRSAYIEFRPTPAIIELAGLSRGQWVLEGVYGHKNGPVDRETARAIRRKLDHAGILVPSYLAQASRYKKAAEILNLFSFTDIDVDGLEDEEEANDVAPIAGGHLEELDVA